MNSKVSIMRRINYNNMWEKDEESENIIRIQNEMGLTCVSNWPAVQTGNLHVEENFYISPPLLFHAKW